LTVYFNGLVLPDRGAGRRRQLGGVVAPCRSAMQKDFNSMDTPPVGLVCLRDQTLREFCAEILRGLGVPEPHARVVGDSLVAANLRGVDSHGVDLLPSYVGQLRISHMFMAIDPGRFMPRDEFENRIGRLVSMMKSSEPASGHSEVLVAGEPEWRTQAQRLREGIPLPAPLWSRLSTIARQVNVTPPELDALG
jgi:LDH2 family malate/lactate/ureidoglycolate dehydrogenase